MKIRNGFVSNSSSSSFVLVGFSISKNEIDDFCHKYYTQEEIDDLEWYDDCIYLEDGDDYLFGEVLRDVSDEDYDGPSLQSTSLPSITTLANEVHKKYNIPFDKIQLFCGRRHC